MERGQFTFYSSFAEAAKQIKNKSARADFYDAICAYALHEEEPNLSKIADAAALGFTLVKPILDTGRRKAKNGQKGGDSKQEQTASKPQANRKQEQPESKGKPEAMANPKQEIEQEIEQEQEKDKEQYVITPPTPSTAPAKANPKQRMETMISETLSGRSAELLAAVRDWTRYKIEKKQGYKETGFQSLLTQIRKSAEEFGDPAVCDVIRDSMGSNYTGIMFDRLRLPRRQGKTQEMVNAGRWDGKAPQNMDKLLKDLDKI